MLENKVKEKLTAAMRKNGWKVVHNENRFMRDQPDLIISKAKRTGVLEVKRIEVKDVIDADSHFLINFTNFFGSAQKGHFRMSQLLELLDWEKHSWLSEYVIAIVDGNKILSVIDIRPSELLVMVKQGGNFIQPKQEPFSWLTGLEARFLK